MTEYLERLNTTLDQFEQKLVDRWQEKVYDCVLSGDAIPPNLHRSSGQGYLDDKYTLPSHQTPEVQAHVLFKEQTGGCAYMNWYDNGRNGKVESVTCDGRIDPSAGSYLGVPVPEVIDCPVGEIFQAAESWAWEDRTIIFNELPLFANQKVNILRTAWEALRDMAGAFGAENRGSAEYHQETQLSDVVHNLSVHGDEADTKDWAVNWTGLAADFYRDGLFTSTKPTLEHHAQLAGDLSQVVNLRSTIINTYRENNIKQINQATQKLGEVSDTSTSFVGLWDIVNGAGLSLALVPLPGAGTTGNVLKLAAFLGHQFLAERTGREYTHEPGEVAVSLYENIRAMKEDLANSHSELDGKVRQLRDNVNQTPSTFLELYDLTENNPTGDGGGGSTEVTVPDLMQLAGWCYEVSERYEEIRRKLGDTDEAHGHLTDKDGEPTAADRDIIALLQEFEQYLRTTTARYYLAGEQIEAAAERYVEAEGLNAERLERLRRDLEGVTDITPDGLGDYEGPGRNPDRDAQDTARPEEATDDMPAGYETDEPSATGRDRDRLDTGRAFTGSTSTTNS